MKKAYWETVDDSEYIKAGEKDIVSVIKGVDYIGEMESQAKRVLAFLKEKNPSGEYRAKWYSHEFGDYVQIEQRIERDYCPFCLYEEDECDCS